MPIIAGCVCIFFIGSLKRKRCGCTPIAAPGAASRIAACRRRIPSPSKSCSRESRPLSKWYCALFSTRPSRMRSSAAVSTASRGAGSTVQPSSQNSRHWRGESGPSRYGSGAASARVHVSGSKATASNGLGPAAPA